MPPARSKVAAEDFLKVIFNVGEWDERGRTNVEIASRLGVSASTASEMVKRLSDDGLVHHERYGDITLTAAGTAEALRMVRRHRLLETYLVDALGYTWDEVHDEAEVLEHAVSDLMLERIDASLGHPWRDPHGDAIPTADGVLHQPVARPLASMEPGETGYVARILDEDPELLRWFDSVGVRLDVAVAVVQPKPFGGPLETTVDGRPLDLGVQAVNALWLADSAPTDEHGGPEECHYPSCRHVTG